MANVLCVGIDPAVVHTRKLILERAGHTAVTARSPSEIVAVCEKTKFDVAVIGQVERAKVKLEWQRAIRRQCPSARILELYMPSLGVALNDADDWLPSPAEPSQLAIHVALLAGQHKKAANQ